jgi:NADPH:quinone reductase-like Zn-dependent oxidoreductase
MTGNEFPLPQNVGYSMVARVAAVGEGVTDFKKGDLVVATGEHAEYLILNEHIVTPAPEGIGEEQAAFLIVHKINDENDRPVLERWSNRIMAI